MLPQILALALALFSVQAASAQTYPTRPITIVVAFAAGGSSDLIARVLAQHMRTSLGQPVIVENKGGADGAIGTEGVSRAAPDGYTLILSTTSTHAINPLLYKTIKYNPSKDFQPISLVAQSPNILVSSNAFDAKSVADVIARAKASPGKLNVATGATMHLLNAAMFKSMANVTWLDVPYKGSGPALNDLVAGQVDLMFDQLPSSLAQVQGGRLKAVAVTSAKRTSIAPEIPTIAEAGLPQFEATSWWGVFAPPNTPPDIVARLNAAVAQALKEPKLLETFRAMGLETWPSTPDEFAKLLVDEKAKWQKVIADNKIEVN
ncbi:tripartite tricarboxylate transporter family receptor [Variibacter gotjawalensis]|uniref:Tripartite tricarboxylate transporter family receptor n=1 Tax=Variibacter gotjawalensis TaxID=1333996 RepID=A0A0S3PR60_9BRAD|nr:tripartite tricarboxylate transporter substrate binding protein [Variibacter gotjawalensis]NIK48754.1 tripartite-type tricarboxylate transporter receptor subunit TctC [Variibacter gotjawalensis]RZS50615.1 tripartite-type tricarboxylate transporter receptor subunit TctC [Variibacter gotjawalensis]BAT58449.1 tripartite tricarboxylate transporter family receptor [Variibacter gotjawalensis]